MLRARPPGLEPGTPLVWARVPLPIGLGGLVVLRAHPGTRTRNSAADIPGEPGRYRAPLPIGADGRGVVLALIDASERRGDRTRLQPLSAPWSRAVTHGRCGPRALPHDPRGHPGNAGCVVHGQS